MYPIKGAVEKDIIFETLQNHFHRVSRPKTKAVSKHIALLHSGVVSWNSWRKNNPQIKINLNAVDLSNLNLKFVNLSNARLSAVNFANTDLSEANLEGAVLVGTNFYKAKISNANFRRTNLENSIFMSTEADGTDFAGSRFKYSNCWKADFSCSNFFRTDFRKAILWEVNAYDASFEEANLFEVELCNSSFKHAYLVKANLIGADLTDVILSGSNLSKANISNSNVYGVSAWDVNLYKTKQNDLIIGGDEDNPITVDNLEIAQFVYLLINNKNLRNIIDTLASKVVLILGRFATQEKKVLTDIKKLLKTKNLIPIIFDFDKPKSRDITETISTIAHISRYIIVDITNVKSVPQELQAIIPHLPSVPIQPILRNGCEEYAMFDHFKKYPWVLNTIQYINSKDLIKSLSTGA